MREKKSKYQNRAEKAAKEQNRQKSQQQKTARTWGIGIAIVSILLVLSMGWFRLDDPVFWIVIAVMVVIYVLVWLFQYLFS